MCQNLLDFYCLILENLYYPEKQRKPPYITFSLNKLLLKPILSAFSPPIPPWSITVKQIPDIFLFHP